MDIYLQGMRDRSMRSGTEMAREIKLTDWSMAGNLSNRSSGVQIPRDICTRLKRYLYSAKCSWIINCGLSHLRFGNHVKKFGSNFNQGFSSLSNSNLKCVFVSDTMY